MQIVPISRSTRAITRTEVAVILIAVLFVGALLMSVIPRVRQSQQEGVCDGNLFQIGNAFSQFATDNGGSYPLSVPGGMAYTNETEAWRHFQAVAGYLAGSTPECLVCPLDTSRLTNTADNFSTGSTASATSLVNKTNSAVSYFVGLDAGRPAVLSASPTRAWPYVAGDRAAVRGSNPVVAFYPGVKLDWIFRHGRQSDHVNVINAAQTLDTIPIAGLASASTSSAPAGTNRLLMPSPPQ